MKVREVFPGTVLDPNSAFIELQMHTVGQNFVLGHRIDVYDSNSLDHFFVFPGNAGNGESQRTILVGDTTAAGSPDFTDATLAQVPPLGGAVCFPDAQPPDCVEWGAGTSAVLPGATGNPVAPAGIPNGSSITRSIGPGCPTLLEATDDTDDSVTDFAVSAPAPRNNATTPTELACTQPVPPPVLAQPTTSQFNLAKAIKRCKKKFPKGTKARKKCIRKARQRAGAA
jgi:hypothetical protein